MKDIHRDMERDRVLMAAEGEEGGRLTLVFYQRRRQRSVVLCGISDMNLSIYKGQKINSN